MKSNFKIFFMLILVAISVAACKPKQGKEYVIHGTIQGAADEMIQVEMLSFPNINSAPKATIMDTVKTDEEGEFAFTNIQSGPAILRIRSLQDPNYQIILSVNNDNIEINADPTTTENPDVKGSASNASFYEFINTSSNYKNSILSKRDEVQTMRGNGNDSLAAIAEAEYSAENKKYIDFILQYADTAKSVANKIIAIESLQFTSQFDLIKAIADNIFAMDTSTVYAKELQSKIARYESFLISEKANSFVGKQAPEIALRNPDGKVFKLSELQGKLVLLDFWASWCGPCRKENPNVVNVYNKFRDKGFTVYSVSLDGNRDAWMRAIKSDKLDWPYHVSELKEWESSAATAYNVSGIPASYLIDKNGVIISENLRGAALEKAVEEYLDKN